MAEAERGVAEGSSGLSFLGWMDKSEGEQPARCSRTVASVAVWHTIAVA